MDKGAWFTGPKMVLGGTNNPFTLVFAVVVLGCLFFFWGGGQMSFFVLASRHVGS